MSSTEDSGAGMPPEHPPSTYSPPLGGAAPASAGEAPNGGAGGSTPSPEETKTWKWAALALAALAVVLLVAFAAAMLVDGRESNLASAPTTTQPEGSTSTTTNAPTTTEPTQTTEPDGPSATSDPATTSTTAAGSSGGSATSTTSVTPDPEVRAQIEEITAFVERSRGLKFKTKPVVQFADEEDFTAELLKDFGEDTEEMKKASITYRALGFIEPNEDLETVLRRTLELGVVGFYEPDTGRLFVRGTSLSAYARTVVAHELTHALDDQHFNLDRPALEKSTDESEYGFTVLAEGSASYVEAAYRETFTAAEEREASAEETSMGNNPIAMTLPVDVVKLVTGPYTQGPELIAAIVKQDGMDGVDASFGSPPISSEQVMTPEDYLKRDPVATVAKPSFEGTEVESGSLGQFALTVLLQDEFDFDLTDPVVPAENWAGDQFVSYTSDRGDCTSFDVQMDDAESAAALHEALTAWASEMPDAESKVSDKVVSTTSCIRPTGGAAQSGA